MHNICKEQVTNWLMIKILNILNDKNNTGIVIADTLRHQKKLKKNNKIVIQNEKCYCSNTVIKMLIQNQDRILTNAVQSIG